jgi:superoxide reductase
VLRLLKYGKDGFVMKSVQKFYVCKRCGNFAGLIENKGVPIVCCGEKMTELVPNTVEASEEKHLPVVTVKDSLVSVAVGSAPHPMEDGHHIAFIYLETEQGGQRKSVKTSGPAKADLCVCDDSPVAVYAYCNLHGLWNTEVA